VIGDLPLERINAGHVEAVLAAVPGSAATRHRVLATLRATLSAAVKQRQITFNPCTGIELEPENPPEARRWTPEQARQFIHATADDPMGLLFRIAILTGERRGGLRWAGVNLTGGVLTIDRTLLQLGGKLTEGTPKTRAGVRRVYLDPGTAALLRAHRETQDLERQFAGEAWTENDLVFCQGDGRPWNPRLRVQAVPAAGRRGGGAGDQAARDAALGQLADARGWGGPGAADADRRPCG
jgi:integrase